MSIFPDHWQLLPLEEVMDAIIDYRGKTPKKTELGIPLITAKIVKEGRILEPAEFIAEKDYKSWMVRGFPKIDDVVITTEAPLGEVAQLTDSNVALAQRIVTLRGKDGVLYNDFLLCAMQSNYVQHQLESRSTGSTVKGIKQSELRKILLPIPPIEEQIEIAHILKTLNNKIELNRQTNQTLEQIAQAIFKSWFVDFEPTRAKITAKKRWIALNDVIETASPVCYAEKFDNKHKDTNSRNQTLEQAMTQAAMAAISGKTLKELEQLNPEQLQQLKTTADLFPDALVESELGEIPETWNVKRLDEVAENHSTTFDFSQVEEVVFVNTGDVLEGRFLHRNYSSKDGLPGQAKKAIQKDDILYSEIRPKNKRFAYVSEDCDDYVVSTKFMIVRSLGIVHPRYLYQILRQETTIREFNLIAESRSGTFPQITFDSIGYMPIVVPSEDIQKAFMSFFKPIIEKIDLVVKEGKSLVDLRDALLPKLLSGSFVVEQVN